MTYLDGESEADRPHPSEEIEEFCDARWQREGTRRLETAFDAERFVERVGFAGERDAARQVGAAEVDMALPIRVTP